jgi:hypothetical protein
MLWRSADGCDLGVVHRHEEADIFGVDGFGGVDAREVSAGSLEARQDRRAEGVFVADDADAVAAGVSSAASADRKVPLPMPWVSTSADTRPRGGRRR